MQRVKQQIFSKDHFIRYITGKFESWKWKIWTFKMKKNNFFSPGIVLIEFRVQRWKFLTNSENYSQAQGKLQGNSDLIDKKNFARCYIDPNTEIWIFNELKLITLPRKWRNILLQECSNYEKDNGKKNTYFRPLSEKKNFHGE